MKIITAQLAKLYNNFKKFRQKLLKTNAANWFNKICRVNSSSPSISVSIPRKIHKGHQDNISGNKMQEHIRDLIPLQTETAFQPAVI